MICLNAATTRQPWLGTLPNTFEQLLSISATIACDAMEKGYQVGLISTEVSPILIIPSVCCRSHFQSLAFLLQTLAAATDYITAPFEQFLLQSLGKIPLGSALVIVSACTTGLMIDSLVRMQRYRSHITLVALDEAPPPTLPGISVVHLPFAE